MRVLAAAILLPALLIERQIEADALLHELSGDALLRPRLRVQHPPAHAFPARRLVQQILWEEVDLQRQKRHSSSPFVPGCSAPRRTVILARMDGMNCSCWRSTRCYV